jgi:hypothetical protein
MGCLAFSEERMSDVGTGYNGGKAVSIADFGLPIADWNARERQDQTGRLHKK